jgi:uncharacterized repeat protein (TIGR03803 family)
MIDRATPQLLSRCALGVSAAAILLAGCSGSQAPAAPGAMPQVRGIAAPSYDVLFSFDGSDGAEPAASLIDVNGTFYGTTAYGGTHDEGTVFSIDTTGTEHVLHSFNNSSSDGGIPSASLINVKGTLYGTTVEGGTHGEGTVFSISTSGTEYVLYNFGSGSDGALPRASLIDAKGTLYGTTLSGGTHREGTVFTISTAGTEHVLYNFGGRPDGAAPWAHLIDVHGTLYGTTRNGGTHTGGTVFALSP